MRKANEMGAFTIALTNNGESAVAKEAKRSFVLNTPKMQDDFPGLRSYFASMIGLIAIACRMGRVRNVLPPNSEKRLAESLKAYVHRYAEVLDLSLIHIWRWAITDSVLQMAVRVLPTMRIKMCIRDRGGSASCAGRL